MFAISPLISLSLFLSIAHIQNSLFVSIMSTTKNEILFTDLHLIQTLFVWWHTQNSLFCINYVHNKEWDSFLWSSPYKFLFVWWCCEYFWLRWSSYLKINTYNFFIWTFLLLSYNWSSHLAMFVFVFVDIQTFSTLEFMIKLNGQSKTFDPLLILSSFTPNKSCSKVEDKRGYWYWVKVED